MLREYHGTIHFLPEVRKIEATGTKNRHIRQMDDYFVNIDNYFVNTVHLSITNKRSVKYSLPFRSGSNDFLAVKLKTGGGV